MRLLILIFPRWAGFKATAAHDSVGFRVGFSLIFHLRFLCVSSRAHVNSHILWLDLSAKGEHTSTAKSVFTFWFQFLIAPLSTWNVHINRARSSDVVVVVNAEDQLGVFSPTTCVCKNSWENSQIFPASLRALPQQQRLFVEISRFSSVNIRAVLKCRQIAENSRRH